MMNPAIPLSPAESLHVMAALLRLWDDPGPRRFVSRYRRDKNRRAPWGRRDQWQPPALTRKLGEGDCEDLLIEWAAHEARKRPVWLCVSQTGETTWHYYGRLEDDTIVDWSREGGMPPTEYGRNESRLKMSPDDFRELDQEGGAGVKVTADEFSSYLKTSQAIVGALAGVIGVAFPAAAPVVAAVGAGYAAVTGGIEAAVAAKIEARRAAKKQRPPAQEPAQERAAASPKPKQATEERKPRATVNLRELLNTGKASKLAEMAAKRGVPASPKDVEDAQEVLALAAMAEADENAAGALMAMLQKKPVSEDGDISRSAIAARLALMDRIARGQAPGGLSFTELMNEAMEQDSDAHENPDTHEGDGGLLIEKHGHGGACCSACAQGLACEGAGGCVGAGDDGGFHDWIAEFVAEGCSTCPR